MTLRTILIVAAVAGVVVLGVLAYALFRTPEGASAPIEAVPLASTATPTEPPAPPTATTAAPAAEVAASPVQEQAATVAPESTATPAAAEPAETPATAATLFEIVQDGTEARFIIEEVLRGADTTVVGITDQVAGEMAIDATTPANSQVGTILVNARTLTTDNSFRNRAIKNQILRTDDFEFVTFEPLAIEGLPASIAVGDRVEFDIRGNLTVTDVTREALFKVALDVLAPDRIEGLAETTILWADYGLRIPDAPSVDTVEDDVILQLQFVAAAKP